MAVCRILSVVASVAALVIELIIISSIKINIASFGVGIYLCIITLAVNIICCTAVCVLSIKDGTDKKRDDNKRTSGGVLLLLYDAVSPLTKTLYSVKIKR